MWIPAALTLHLKERKRDWRQICLSEVWWRDWDSYLTKSIFLWFVCLKILFEGQNIQEICNLWKIGPIFTHWLWGIRNDEIIQFSVQRGRMEPGPVTISLSSGAEICGTEAKRTLCVIPLSVVFSTVAMDFVKKLQSLGCFSCFF